MKILFRQSYDNKQPVETEITSLNLKESIEKPDKLWKSLTRALTMLWKSI